jgi:F-type H+-transporting ATPase subunit alpha
MRLDLAQFRSLAAFAQFGSDLDRATQRQLDRGLRLTELLKQGQYKPLPLADQVTLIYAGTNGHLDDVPVERVKEWQDGFIRAFNTQYAEIANAIANEKVFTDELRTKLDEALTQFNEGWS